MEEQFVEEKTFERKDFSQTGIEKGEYDLCVFINCNFSNSDLSKIRFIDCEFYDCNLSTANIFQSGFQNALFKDCKMLGLQFDKCSGFAFSIQIDNCQLNHSSFYKRKLSKTVFKKSKLREVDFTECDLSASIFDDCDLLHATFNNTNLQNADFRNSTNFIIDPENNKIKGAKFTLETVIGLLTKYNIKIEPSI
ncbi:pentapeptide repeat-containing protein [Psychroserpens algicola]|uniref:Pentapeptide repeat-containing protein n=1 Tax=Psychroserpens algicola TaxID=1719034 RepID=A0ABT0HCB1_9FLAO|nr:pentapeptide repeat-containing protein [Psychroserpens algicola]MCK8481689.1 pentapeptide repeat-containing protein [Psychroserpens algicola]